MYGLKVPVGFFPACTLLKILLCPTFEGEFNKVCGAENQIKVSQLVQKW